MDEYVQDKHNNCRLSCIPQMQKGFFLQHFYTLHICSIYKNWCNLPVTYDIRLTKQSNSTSHRQYLYSFQRQQKKVKTAAFSNDRIEIHHQPLLIDKSKMFLLCYHATLCMNEFSFHKVGNFCLSVISWKNRQY